MPFIFNMGLTGLNCEISNENASSIKKSYFLENLIFNKNEEKILYVQIFPFRELLSDSEVEFSRTWPKDDLFFQNNEKTQKCI